MKIGNHKHRVERRSHVRISAAHCPLSDPRSTIHDPLTTIHDPLVTSHASRRGVLLLLILALLAMFGLIAVAFVVLTGQAQRSAKSIERIDLAMDPPKNLLQQAAMQVFRGTNNPSSVLGPHSLLEDMYGDAYSTTYPSGYVTGTIGSADVTCGGQLLKIVPSGAQMTAEILARHGGCVLTITKLSNAATQQAVYGQSSHIVYVEPNSTTFYIPAFPGGANITGYPSNLKDASFTINGAPFSGTGFGCTSSGFDGDTALKPNNASNRIPLGGANEDYDAADYQNMLLAAQVYNSTTKQFDTLPSLHRPALIQAKGETVDYVLRPLKATHTNFSGSNSNYTATAGPWDVDNDGDGVPDSVWVDLGMPPRATNDGRLYKPLFAILCTDLDGRLNVNAHGSLPQTATTYSTIASASGNTLAGPPTTANVPRGQGMGPAEINLGELLTAPANIMSGVTSGYQGRYGATKAPGVKDTADYLSLNKWYQYGSKDYWAAAANSTGSYGSPPDPFGAGAVGLDQAGQPAYMATGVYGYGSGVVDLPYEFNFAANVRRGLSLGETTGNNPFSASELERLLRPYDRDATGLPARLAALTSAAGTTPASSELLAAAKRNTFTTDSWDVPCPAVPVVATKNLLTALSARCSDKSKWLLFVPAEVLNGLKMDINRPFGNGQAGANGIVDDPTITTAQTVSLYNGTSSVSATLNFDGTGSLATTSLAARQLEARYLYIMMCLTSDLTYLNTKTGGSDKTARMLAQWAVNAVDFRDRDSIMTPFDYDPAWTTGSSISGWNVTAGTSPRVWGCEKPDLLITETLAFHDRRTSNTDLETDYASETSNPDRTKGGKTNDPADTATVKTRDQTYDQTYRPQGSLFIELYNPTSKVEPHCTDLYTAATAATGELKLDKVADGSPVWRLVIATPTSGDEQPDPDDPDPAATNPDVEREVYFVPESAATALPTASVPDVRFYPSATPTTGSVAPGEYVVVGSAQEGATNPNTTYIGFLTTETSGTSSTRRIDLDQSTKLVQNNTNSPADPATGVAAVKSIGIDSPRRLSVSEPVDGYDTFETAGGPAADGKYTTPYDQPFDARRTDGGQTLFIADGTYPKYRVVYLQRLANPLEKYNATNNPYRTVDMLAIDVTSFNGVCKDEGNTDPLEDDPQLPETPPGDMIATHFQSRQRGERNDDASQYNIWKQEPVEKPLAVFTTLGDAPTSTTHYFESDLKHSLGHLNQPYGNPTTTPYTGAPTKPFPWLTWNNRPFVSPLELMLVPAVRSSKLLVNASNGTTKTTGDASYNKFFNILKSSDSSASLYSDLDGANVPYPHLLNFFQSNASSATTSAQFHRILEYLCVPSLFVSADTQANPGTATSPFLPPFNRISNYREPGRINLNTIYNEYVFKGLMAGFPAMATDDFWHKFVASRQGNTAATNNVLGYVAGMPSEFACPFRSFAGYTYSPSDVQTKLGREINSTLLRADPTNANKPLFQFDSGDFSSYSADYNNPERNPFFRYQGLTRLGNLVTTRSNVYAVWITVGYFEYTSTGLGQELGVDTGEIDRHRAFYIFDRSIPVGFQRGQDLNVEKAILVNRYIE